MMFVNQCLLVQLLSFSAMACFDYVPDLSFCEDPFSFNMTVVCLNNSNALISWKSRSDLSVIAQCDNSTDITIADFVEEPDVQNRPVTYKSPLTEGQSCIFITCLSSGQFCQDDDILECQYMDPKATLMSSSTVPSVSSSIADSSSVLVTESLSSMFTSTSYIHESSSTIVSTSLDTPVSSASDSVSVFTTDFPTTSSLSSTPAAVTSPPQVGTFTSTIALSSTPVTTTETSNGGFTLTTSIIVIIAVVITVLVGLVFVVFMVAFLYLYCTQKSKYRLQVVKEEFGKVNYFETVLLDSVSISESVVTLEQPLQFIYNTAVAIETTVNDVLQVEVLKQSSIVDAEVYPAESLIIRSQNESKDTGDCVQTAHQQYPGIVISSESDPEVDVNNIRGLIEDLSTMPQPSTDITVTSDNTSYKMAEHHYIVTDTSSADGTAKSEVDYIIADASTTSHGAGDYIVTDDSTTTHVAKGTSGASDYIVADTSTTTKSEADYITTDASHRATSEDGYIITDSSGIAPGSARSETLLDDIQYRFVSTSPYMCSTDGCSSMSGGYIDWSDVDNSDSPQIEAAVYMH